MNRYTTLLCVVLSLLCRLSTAAITSISGTWSDDFANDENMINGWNKWGGSDTDTSIFTNTTGDTGTYHRFTRTSSSNQDKHQYLARYFKCAEQSYVSIDVSIAGCADHDGSSGDHFRVYALAYDGTSASSANYSNVGLDELYTDSITMPDDGTMSTFTNMDSVPCNDWSEFYMLNLSYSLTVKSGEDYFGKVDANTTWELYMKWKFADQDQFGHMWNLRLTCEEIVVPTG